MGGQGSLEYLLILAAILAIAVVVVLIANMLLGTPQEANIINEDKYNAAVAGWELIGYNQILDYSTVESAKQTTVEAIKQNEVTLNAKFSAMDAVARCDSSTDVRYFSRGDYYTEVEGYRILFTFSNGIDVWYTYENVDSHIKHVIDVVRYGNPAVHCHYVGWECDDGSYLYYDNPGCT